MKASTTLGALTCVMLGAAIEATAAAFSYHFHPATFPHTFFVSHTWEAIGRDWATVVTLAVLTASYRVTKG